MKGYSAFGSFFPRLSAIFLRGRGKLARSKITSRRFRSFAGQLSFFLVPNMVLSKMNNHENRTMQTYESYTFQPLILKFLLESNIFNMYSVFPRSYLVKLVSTVFQSDGILKSFSEKIYRLSYKLD